MTTRAKLQCQSVKDMTDGNTVNPQKTGENLSFSAVYTGTPEDNIFSLYTPVAGYSMNVTNPELYGKFEEGKSYYFDISPCE